MDTLPETDDAQKPGKKNGKKQITLERLRIALEKLQLARAKVCITFIVLGFTFYKFFYARIEAGKRPLMEFPNGRHVGIILIGVGLVSLLLGTIQHRISLADLKQTYKEMVYSVSLILSYFILALALFLLLVVIFEL